VATIAPIHSSTSQAHRICKGLDEHPVRLQQGKRGTSCTGRRASIWCDGNTSMIKYQALRAAHLQAALLGLSHAGEAKVRENRVKAV
jgi:hypothetical protein